MTLPSSGPMTAAMINVELGRAANAPFDINGTEERALAEVPSGEISFSDFYGKSAGGDPYWLQVIMLAHFDSIAGNIYPNDGGDPIISMAKAAGSTFNTSPPTKFNGNNYFNGQNGAGQGYVSLSPVTAFYLNYDYWTIEGWFYELAGSGGSIMTHRDSGTTGWSLQTYQFRARINGVWSATQLSWARPSFDAWHFFALVKDRTELRMYIDGVLVDTLTGVNTIDYNGTNSVPTLGYGSQPSPQEFPFKGYMDDIRFTRNADGLTPGCARYSGPTCPVPTEPFPNYV